MRERVNEPIELPTDELRAMRPPSDRLQMESARERAERALFGSAAPAKLGRYVLLGQTADGGMGMVHAAYDPELHRKVALKVMHPVRRADARAGERLIAEARALAKLDHPNVVKVHDVIMQADQVVIVMEWIDGGTVATWERAHPRSWREVVAVYAQAAQGLAAVHGVGVIHRDFKPANAIVGTDGRVRVVDFGLARASDRDGVSAAPRDPDAATTAADDGWMASLTATGDMVGTLAYAAPEQLTGTAVTPASDQFAFGVSLHRALESVSPFDGSDPASLARSIRAGQIARAADGRSVPPWLRAIVARALSAESADRFPSMAALHTELVRPRGWRRWRLPLFVALCTAAAILAFLIRPGAADPEADCDGGRADMQAVWGAVPRVGVQAALMAVATPYASEIHDKVLRGLDDYRDRWVALHRDACIAYRRGRQSAVLLDRRMGCMQQRLGDLRAAVSALAQLDSTTVVNALDVIARMPEVAQCSDIERLNAETPPPSDIAQRAKVSAARAEVSRAAALDRAGRSAEALTAATAAITLAEQTAYPPVVAEALMAQGRILLARWDNSRAAAAFRRARAIALAQHQLAIAVEAAARLLYAEGMQHADVAAAERDASVFLPLSEGLPGDRFARPLLLNNLGAVYTAAGDRVRATEYFRHAHDALAAVRSPDLELTIIDRNLALVTSDAGQREALARGVWRRLQDESGDAHLSTVVALISYARYIAEPARALPLLTHACQTLDAFHPELVEQRVYCEAYRAFLLGQVGDVLEQRRSCQAVVRTGSGSTSGDVISHVALAHAQIRLLNGDPSGAIAELEPAARSRADSPHWWEQVLSADVSLVLGTARRLLGQDLAAERALTAARDIYQRIVPINEEAEQHLKLSVAQRELATVRDSSAAAGSRRRDPSMSGWTTVPVESPERAAARPH